MSSDCSTSSKGGRSHKRQRGIEDRVLEHRLSHGLCDQCGAKLYNVVGTQKRLDPLNIDGIVVNGRCLLCYPLRNIQCVSVGSPAKDSTRATSTAQHPGDDDSEAFGKRKEECAVNGPRAPCRGDEQKAPPEGKLLTTSIRDADGLVYVGRVERGNLETGEGVFTHLHAEGENAGKVSIFEGEFENSLFHGKGISKDASGCVYEGEFLRGAAHGQGKCRWEEQGWRYEGSWANDKRHGHGTCSQMEEGGEVYSGSWKDDQWDSVGTLKFAGGGQYVGEFKKDKLHGKGVYTFADGSVYNGYFKNDMRQGHGEMTYSDGFRYVGAWRNNWRNGKGTLFYPNGSVFKGNFSGDDRDGIGYLHLPDGIVQKQKWVNGVLQDDSVGSHA